MIAGKIGKFDSLKCSNCGSNIMFTKIKGNNTGLYCIECGKWQKWLSKNEKNLWDSPVMQDAIPKEKNAVNTHIDNVSKLTGFNTFSDKTMPERLQKFIDAIEKKISIEMMTEPKSDADQIRKCSYCLALEQCKTSLENILADREFNDDAENK